MLKGITLVVYEAVSDESMAGTCAGLTKFAKSQRLDVSLCRAFMTVVFGGILLPKEKQAPY